MCKVELLSDFAQITSGKAYLVKGSVYMRKLNGNKKRSHTQTIEHK